MKIKANGTEINYQFSGKQTGPVVVLSHSLGCSIKMWDAQVTHLDPEFRVLTFDTRGHGLSDAPAGPYTLDILGQDAVGLLDALNLREVHWVGMSMGGMIGQNIAINHPEYLQSLTLCDTGPFMPPEKQLHWKELLGKVHAGGMEAVVQETMQDWFTPEFLSKNSPALAEIEKQFLSTSVTGYEGCIRAIMELNYINQLHEIKAPTLIMVGEKDLKVPVKISELMHEKIPGSELITIPDSAHLSSIGQPKRFNRHLLDFLRKQNQMRQ